jgi:hypothetical protein
VGSVVVLTAVLGIAAVPAVSYSAGTGQRQGQYAAESFGAKPKKHKKAKTCKKGRVKKAGRCVKEKTSSTSRTAEPGTTTPATATTPATPLAPATSTPEAALSATIVIHTINCGNPPPETTVKEGCRAVENAPLRISRLGPNGEALSRVETEDDTVEVAPGHYGVAAVWSYGETPEKEVTVTARETVEVTLYIERI